MLPQMLLKLFMILCMNNMKVDKYGGTIDKPVSKQVKYTKM